MISAPFLPGCPSLLDRAAWLMIARGAFDQLSWPSAGAAAIALFFPAALLSALAMWAVTARRPNVAAIVLLTALAVHPAFILALGPILLFQTAQGSGLRAAGAAIGALLIYWLATPPCKTEATLGVTTFLRNTVFTLQALTGLIVPVLALFESLRRPRGRHVRLAWWLVITSAIAASVFRGEDARVTLVPAGVALWWLAASAARAMVKAQQKAIFRVATAVFLALVPVLYAAERSAVPSSAIAPPGVRAIIDALNETWWPAAFVSEDTAHDLIVKFWRAGEPRRDDHVQVISVSSAGIANLLSSRVVYAFARGARALRVRGVWVGPIDPAAPATQPILWRALAAPGCWALSQQWQDVTSLASEGALSAVFSRGGTGRHTVIYAVVPRGTTISTIGWSPHAGEGYRASLFDLTDPQQKRSFDDSIVADDMPPTMIQSTTNFVARLRVEHVERTAGALTVSFDASPRAIVARLDTGRLRDTIDLCHASDGLPIVGYRESPRTVSIDLGSPAIGPGWHGAEGTVQGGFRWTAAPEALIKFLAVNPVPLALTLRIGGAAAGPPEARTVTLNGVPARCDGASPGCSWTLPFEAMRVGLNVVAIGAPVVPGPTSDPRILGLQVMGAELRHLAPTDHERAVRRR